MPRARLVALSATRFAWLHWGSRRTRQPKFARPRLGQPKEFLRPKTDHLGAATAEERIKWRIRALLTEKPALLSFVTHAMANLRQGTVWRRCIIG
ncbi:hypothetical protein CGMCC3_g8089 [Colletotrichum fructicola]|nr:uncharacterized protein CGMCC3_g8089 [Colletotrichum fructicola]KAE9575985.1 hypothetical protein CGMCC3_g8089 [Colletotrichum fructicola]